MRIGVDVRDLSIARTGARTYLQEVVEALRRAAPQHEVIRLAPSTPLRLPGRSAAAKLRGHLDFIWWKELALPALARRQRCDFLLCTDYVVPLWATARAVPVFHDANFWSNPDQYNRTWRTLMDLLALPAARRAPAVVTVSEFAKAEIVHHTGIAPARIVVIPNAPKSAVARRLAPAEIEAVLQRYAVDPEVPFVLHVGVMEKRKNLVRLVHAFARLRAALDTPYQLVLVGQPGPKRDMDDSAQIRAAVAEHRLEESVRQTGHVDDAELPAFYQAASIYAFPSLREGFGIPALEAFQNDLPVAAARSSALPEVTGDAALLFDPLDLDTIAQALLRLATDAELRRLLIARGRDRLACFSWDESARRLVALFETLSGGSDAHAR